MATTLYFIVVPANSTAPTAAQIVAGVDYGAVTVLDSGSVAYTSTGTYDADSAPVTGASAGVAYDQWWVAYDGVTYGTPVEGEITAACTAALAATGGSGSLVASASITSLASLAATGGTGTLSASASPTSTVSLAATGGTGTLSASAYTSATAELAATGGSGTLSAEASVAALVEAAITGGSGELSAAAEGVVEEETRRRGGHTWIHARKKAQRLALQTWWDYLTEEEPSESTKRVIAEVKAGRPVPQTKPPKGPPSISAEKLADKIIPSRLWTAQNLIVDNVDLQRVVANAIRIAQERDDEEIMMLL